ncbi:uncharacterized protein BO88DRAFT_77143 [Aspergillus vadensis CBS 113365]|uniref:Secreted protein n=1 Tax=Aspergillus vadensis (strain CBS 113365 / IMI 142717 / IBT 24658) TaxID=1448311 RepID=A0A319B4P0_ASPVC|nr:hypothetical protein BO88DRAFT_77143 [Aspergillus vadensis CBS 113365]PYH67747.1 hypothetical protein BO88DRAFT_77143 [Aspergillus vadensis CBS 113365]
MKHFLASRRLLLSTKLSFLMTSLSPCRACDNLIPTYAHLYFNMYTVPWLAKGHGPSHPDANLLTLVASNPQPGLHREPLAVAADGGNSSRHPPTQFHRISIALCR